MGAIMTVEIARFSSLGETTTHGRVLAVSDPVVGSRRTRNILNRSITIAIPLHQTRWSLGELRQDHQIQDVGCGRVSPNWHAPFGADAKAVHQRRVALPIRRASGSKPIRERSSSWNYPNAGRRSSQFCPPIWPTDKSSTPMGIRVQRKKPLRLPGAALIQTVNPALFFLG